MRRTISFLLGMVFGIVFLLSSIGIVAYVGVAIVKPNDVFPESEPILGGLSDTTILKLVQDLAEKYKAEASGVAPDGGYYTVGDFVTDYNVTIATDLPQDVKDMPLLQYFAETDAEGDTGFVRAMKDVKVSAILSLANFIQGNVSEEEGKVLFDEETIAELSNYTLYEMIMDEEKGVNYVLQNVKLAQIVPDAFPAEESENKLMWAVGQTEIGKAIEALSGDNNLFLQLNEGGALASLGSLQIVDIVGDDSPLLSGLLTHTTIADLINEHGELVPDTLLETLELGVVLGLQKNRIENVDYTVLNLDDSDGLKVVLYKDDSFLMSQDGGQTCFEAKKGTCPEEDGHYCGYECFDYVWYETVACADPTHITDADHLYDGDICVDGVYYQKASSLYNIVANLDLTMLVGGDSDALLNTFMNIPLGELLGQETEEGLMNLVLSMSVNDLMAGGYNAFALGDLLQFNKNVVSIENYDFLFIEEPTRVYKHKTNDTYAVSDDAVTLYEARLNCTEEHDHTAKCFDVVWYNQQPCQETHDHAGEALVGENYYAPASGIFAQLASYTIGDITSDTNAILDEVMNVKLQELLGQQLEGPLAALGDMTIAQLVDGSAFDTLYVGAILGYSRKVMDESAFATEVCQQIKTDGANYIKLVDGVWYFANLDCTEEHDHSADCFGAVWYSACADGCTEAHDHETIDGKLYTPATGIAGLLADKTIADFSDINGLVGEVTIRDVLGENIPSMLKTLADTPISQLATEIDTLKFGQILGYTKQGEIWYNCTTDHVHGTGCAVAEGIVAKIADYTIADLSNMQEIVGDLTIRDVLGENIPSMLKTLADTPISQLATEIDTLKLGAILGYTKQGETWYNCETDHVHGAGCTAVDGLMAKFADKKVTELTDINGIISELTLADVLGDNVPSILSSLKDTPIDQLATKIETLKLGEMLGYTLEGGVWYDCETNHAHGAGCTKVDGLMAKFADKTIADLSNLDDIISDLTLADVLGDNIPEMLKSIKDTPVSQLSTAIETLKLGEMLGYALEGGVWYDCDTNHAHGAGCTKVSGLMAKLAGKTVSDLSNLDDIISDFTLEDVLGDNVPTILASLKNTPISQLSTAIDGLKLGEMMGYTLEGGIWYDCDTNHTHGASCTEATGMMAKLAGKTVADLGNLQSTIQSFTLADVLGENVPTMLASIKDTPISDIGTAMDGLKLGEVMGYKLQGTTWYDCATDHTHGAGCTLVDGINGALVDIQIGELGNADTLKNAVNKLTLSELGIGSGNAMLEAVGNVPLLEVGNEINNLQMGVAMGYTLEGGVWYDCDTDHTHGPGCTTVEGVNAKIASLKVNEMGSGLNGVMTSLTIGDLVDSGMMTLEEENQYKLDIIFCNDNTHTTTVTVPFVGTTTVACDLAGFLQWKNVNASGTAKQFFEECHSGLTEEEIEQHRGKWKACTLDNFVNGLLGAIK